MARDSEQLSWCFSFCVFPPPLMIFYLVSGSSCFGVFHSSYSCIHIHVLGTLFHGYYVPEYLYLAQLAAYTLGLREVQQQQQQQRARTSKKDDDDE